MLFNSFTYLVFLPIVVLLYWLLPNSFKKTLLLIASYVFYMNWMPAYGLLILALTLVNYLIGLLIERNQKQKKALLVLGLVFNLACLCFFKYANFLIDSIFQSVAWLHSFVGVPQFSTSPALNIILPLGISFFTFEFIHYITDVYRGSKPVKNLRDFALFAAFFPSQIAGPIKRFQDFTYQLLHEPSFSKENFGAGIFLIFQGLFKKVVLGDNLGQIVGTGFGHIDKLGTLDAWIAVAGFTFQIFFDFSGYTDIGRGSALLFGYRVPENFNWPFLAANLTDFWRRWHMSLSTWLRDYLFIPLGGSRVSAWKVRRNVLITMVLGGLWHGAAWHYVIWGLFHGLGLVLSKEWHDFVSRIPALARLRPHVVWHTSGIALTVFFLFIAGILFRANGMPQALAMMTKLFHIGAPGQVTQEFVQSTVPASLSIYAIFLCLRLLAASTKISRMHPAEAKAGRGGFSRPLATAYGICINWWHNSLPAKVVACASLAVIILGFAPGRVQPFIYFQF
jgi:alginate O-acetyltransferase complex protein AlgI